MSKASAPAPTWVDALSRITGYVSVMVVAVAVATTVITVSYSSPHRTLPPYAAKVCNADLSCAPYERMMYIDGCATCVYTPPIDAISNSYMDGMTFSPASLRFEDETSRRVAYETGWTNPDLSDISVTFATGVTGWTFTDMYVQTRAYPAANNSIGFLLGTDDMVAAEVFMRGTATITNATEAPIVVVFEWPGCPFYPPVAKFTYGTGPIGFGGGFAPIGTILASWATATPWMPAFTVNMKPTQPVGGAGGWTAHIRIMAIDYPL